jgi:predicted acetyltransferase
VLALLQVDADDVRLDRLLQLYMFEWTALIPRPIGPDARFDYPDLPAFGDHERHAAYLFLDGELPVGFALVLHDDAGAWHIEEFFVLIAARRQGLGAGAARQLLATRAARWTWTVRPENPGALAFWRRVAPAAAETVEVGADGVTRTRLTLGYT